MPLKKLDAACREAGVEKTVFLKFIRFEWIQPADPGSEEFDEQDLARARLIRELQEDFGVNDEAVPVILHILDQVYELQNLVEKLRKAG